MKIIINNLIRKSNEEKMQKKTVPKNKTSP